jgi:hypothetical protein
MNDDNLLDSKLPNLSTLMTQIPHSRESFFQERLGVEAMSRDLGDPNVFSTINRDPRGLAITRRLLHELEHGTLDNFDPDYYEVNRVDWPIFRQPTIRELQRILLSIDLHGLLTLSCMYTVSLACGPLRKLRPLK